MILKACVCNILLNCASRKDLTCVGKSVRHGLPIIPKQSKLDLEGVLEAAWEPPLCRDNPKTSFRVILASLGDLIWGSVLGHFGMLFRIPVLGGLQDNILGDFGPLLGSLLETILATFGVPFLY